MQGLSNAVHTLRTHALVGGDVGTQARRLDTGANDLQENVDRFETVKNEVSKI